MRQAIICPGENGYWVVECPSLPCCASRGETPEKAAANIKKAMMPYVDALPVRLKSAFIRWSWRYDR